MDRNDSDHAPEKARTPKGPLGDALPGREEEDPRTTGGQDQERVEDRPVVGQVKPEDYPEKDRRDSTP
ncbi:MULTISPECIES: hypothetical protein [Sphingobium]|uniref:Uncharacterized protein n=1 Tax=Sphingobium fuliginis (strain ATCC 27551) TaxID=336203 RepID=A0ABQ1EPC5_SPHSA|nr:MULTISPECIES: hypothetical protein [Sphingobium]AJR22426.1 hypothetical protein TZ53_00110 [Sphingobium sp. YBL2]RYM00802.1 hypothetical protein EWH10_01685 [Sphingobium fuliginis]UXC89399.1 hypothetical protein EGM87_09935 [Sphingobium sp. RSMS]WDA38286.1 hypothetical protein PO876_08985 [Sphingobium sp. YC-XJ3]GFZ80298.1 hypothetical protein GCM10019071_06530 [Sphingobium fuliginis]